MTIRTRFAPSPTGDLHIGSARTALYCWLYAQKMKGTFVLRIEDTDRERSTEESVQSILEALKWLELTYDEGPYYQTERFQRYENVIAKLLSEEKAYRCYCSKERLEKLRQSQMDKKEKPRYDGHCRNLSAIKSEPFVVRFKNPTDGLVTFNDFIRGKLTFDNRELDDLIIARSDGTPTYNFTVVVDDWDMKISHVFRGDDHINNTPRQINILKALNADIPLYGHMPMILASDGKRLSKRHGAASALQYRHEGYLPQALINYIARLGWSHGDQEIFSRQELIEYFDITKLSKSPAAFNAEKLLWLNHYYLKTSDPQSIEEELKWHMQQFNINIHNGPKLIDLINAQKERCKTLQEMATKSRYFYEDIPITTLFDSKEAVKGFYQGLKILNSFNKELIHELIHETAKQYNLKIGQLAQPLRLILTGGTVSPPIDVTILLLGKEKTLNRLERALA